MSDYEDEEELRIVSMVAESDANRRQYIYGPSFQDLVHDDGIENIQYLIIQKQTITLPNAISLNEALIEQLKTLLARLEQSLSKCRAKYAENEKQLFALSNVSVAKMPRVHISPYDVVYQAAQFCASPYFKTIGGKMAPLNPEALYRQQQNTLYPYDLLNVRSQWTLADKSLLLRLMTTTILDYGRKNPTLIKTKLSERMKLSRLVQEVQDLPFTVDWTRISDQLFNRHSAAECQSMWRLVLHPHLRHDRWTHAEDDMLLAAARQHNFQNWDQVAESIETPRSMFQCFLRYHTTFLSASSGRKAEKFTPEEDKRLLELVGQHRTGDLIPWGTIARFFPERPRQTLYYRYVFSLRPNISHERFSVEEDCIFLAALQEYGTDFRRIAAELPNRTMVQVRAHYNNVLKRNSEVTTPWCLEDDEKLMRLQKEGHSWAQIADILKTHNRMMCRARHTTITKFLAKYPKKTIKDVARRKRKAKNGVTTANWASKLTEISQTIVHKKFSPKDLIKLASFANLLDVKIDEQLIEECEGEFDRDEVSMLREAISQKDEDLMDIPMHKPTLVAFERVRGYLAETAEDLKPQRGKTYSKQAQVERENFKKQFKALFYLPGVMATMKPDVNSTTIDTKYGLITITY